MYTVTVKKGYFDLKFKFNTWDGASEFMLIAINHAEEDAEVIVTKECEGDGI